MANGLTITRILLVLPIALFLILGWHWAAFWVFILASLTDLIDGALARALGDAGPLGAALDPIADKMLTSGVLLALVGAQAIFGAHIFAAILILLREFFVGGLREVLAGKQSLPVSPLAKWKTTLQFVALAMLMLPFQTISTLGLVALWLATGLTLWTGFDYAKAGLAVLTRENSRL